MERRHTAPGAATEKTTRRAGSAKATHVSESALRRRFAWPIWITTRIVLPCFILLSIAAGIFWVKLLNGPISLRFIAEPIARAISNDLPGFAVSIEDATVLLAEGRGLEFRLRNVNLVDPRGMTIARAPDAAITLSGSALWSGKFAPSRIILIEPSIVLQYSRERGLSLGFAEAARTEGGAGRVAEAPPVATAQVQAEIGSVIGSLFAQANQTVGAASYIRGIGLRNATLAIDSSGQRAAFRVREADIGIDRRREGRMLGASLVMDSSSGPWQVSMVANHDDQSSASSIDLRIADLVPSAVAAAWPLLAPVAALDLPINGTASFKFAGSGELTTAIADLEFGRGVFAPGLRGNGRMVLDGGRIAAKYDPAARRISFSTTRFASGASWAAFQGGIGFAVEPGRPWQIELAAVEGQLAAEEFGQGPRPLEAFRVRAALDPQTGGIDIAEAVLKAAGGEITMSGQVPPKGSAARMLLQGRLSPMGVDAVKLLWPSIIAPSARLWSGKQIQQGRLAGGTFVVEDVGVGAERGRGGADGLRIGVSLEGTNVRIQPKPGFAPVEAPRVLVRLESNALEVAAPEAVILTTPQRRLPIRGVRLVASDVTAPTSMGDLTFRAQGALQPALDLAEQQATRNGRGLVLPGEGLDGRVDAQVRIQVPLGDDVHAEDTRLEIKGRVTDGRARGVFGGWEVTGASLGVDVTDQQLDIKGDMLVAGVPAKLALRRIFAAPESEQPPVLVTTTLDTENRTQLGLDVNEFVSGEMPIELLITPRPQGEPQIQVRANLVNAELILEALAWKKAPGRPATLQFEIARPSKQRTELQGFRIVGEDISLAGNLVLDGRNKLREFSFQELVLHVVSRLQMSGTLRNDNVWDVTARGQTLDGRDFFKSLFSFSQVRSKPLPPRKDQAGLDIKVEIDNVLGHQEVALKNLKLQMSNRGGRTTAMHARGVVESGGKQAGAPLEVTISQAGREPRRLLARSEDAGQVFRMIGFFPNMLGGTMNLDVNLDGGGAADKTGRLNVWNFAILGDAVGDGLDGLDQNANARGQRRVQQRSRLDFISMNAPFELGHGQVVISDADLRGQVLGVLLRGKADFRQQTVDLGGTYVPLQGLNSALGQFPILGVILAGPRGEGVIGMTFRVHGPMARPQVDVNPASIVPGIFREMMQMTTSNPRITPRDAQPAPTPPPEPTKSAPKKAAPRSASPGKASDAVAVPVSPQIDPDGGWNSNAVRAPSPRAVPRTN